ncbi:shikimate dehydrogenase [endosymbiont of unidentified scaly snail isolate Monju]|uniref:shikimate dehydrogenase n=1 Tax=endosymbiont of unidentified scaly snail isolate Monju TaxID=1248727 RepID=UPI0003892CF8|nr:shikimate dehydrogenase [endosymbiont of unidentified scaly snail isolate Monju]BAN68066.1 shikimate dehydrogenase [endosymbiont of unidentified scaly snail isolate Monju]
MSDRYAVIGNPIEHSRSPEIHALFARQTGQDMEYGRILGSLDDFADDVRRFIAEGGRGLNVTVPFKEQAFALADERSERAQRAGAVNTLVFEGNRIRGDNTDGAGLVRDLGCNHRFAFAGSRILLLGAGGASRGVLFPLLEEGPAALVIANRTAHKALELAALADDPRVTGCGLDALAGQRFDLIVNGTAAGLAGGVPAIPDDCLAEDGWTYDMMYGREPTAFVRWGREHGAARALDGLGMLVEQAAESFLLWRGVMPDTGPVIDALRYY